MGKIIKFESIKKLDPNEIRVKCCPCGSHAFNIVQNDDQSLHIMCDNCQIPHPVFLIGYNT